MPEIEYEPGVRVAEREQLETESGPKWVTLEAIGPDAVQMRFARVSLSSVRGVSNDAGQLGGSISTFPVVMNSSSKLAVAPHEKTGFSQGKLENPDASKEPLHVTALGPSNPNAESAYPEVEA